MKENQDNKCGRCGAAVSEDAVGGLCPRCLMAMNFESRTVPEGGEAGKTAPLSPDELAEKFPQFEILECLGRGGMGVVYKARQKSLNRLVAIKILAPEREHEIRFAERFAREAELLAQLNQPHIVTIHDFGETGGLFYLVMEYVDGVNLRDLMRDGKLEPEQALAIVPPVCEALQYAHDKGIVHRDIKPENLLLDKDGRIKIADFGIAGLVGSGGENTGTPPYMAPEQGGPNVDNRADIYALGVVLYEMLTGERPAAELVAPSKKVEIDVRLDEMVMRALEKEPELRYQTAGEFQTVVETMQPARPPAVPDPLPPAIPNSPAPRGMIRRWWWMFLVMIPGSLVIGLLAASAFTFLAPKIYETHALLEVLLSGEAGARPGSVPVKEMELKSRENLSELSQTLELENRWMSGEDEVIRTLLDIITVRKIKGTELISISARHTNAEDCAAIVNALCDDYRELSDGRVMVIERAVVPEVPDSPNIMLNVVGLGVIGLLLSPLLALLAMALLQRMFPERRREDDPAVSAGTNPWEPVTVVVGAVVAIGLLVVARDARDAVRIPAYLGGMATLFICGLSFAGKWPFRSPVFPAPNFSSRNLRRGRSAMGRVAGGLCVLLGLGVATWSALRIADPELPVLPWTKRTVPEVINPEIGLVWVVGDKVTIEGKALAGDRIEFHAGERENGWSCAFPKTCRFTATLEQGKDGLVCRVQPDGGEPILTLGKVNRIGDVTVADGKLVFRAGEPRVESAGIYSVAVGEWTADGGQIVPVSVTLSGPQAEVAKSGDEPSFGPVIERLLSSNDSLENGFLDVESGRVLSASPEFVEMLKAKGQMFRGNTQLSNLVEWARGNGVDFVVQDAAQVASLQLLEGFCIASTASFESSVAGEVVQTAQNIESTMGPVVDPGFHMSCQMSSEIKSWVFKTRDGSMGVLELRQISDKPVTVTVRYKLVKPNRPNPLVRTREFLNAVSAGDSVLTRSLMTSDYAKNLGIEFMSTPVPAHLSRVNFACDWKYENNVCVITEPFPLSNPGHEHSTGSVGIRLVREHHGWRVNDLKFLSDLDACQAYEDVFTEVFPEALPWGYDDQGMLLAIPPEAATLMVEMKELRKSPAYVDIMDDPEAMKAFVAEGAVRYRALTRLLRDTEVWPLWVRRSVETRVLRKAIENDDDAALRQASARNEELSAEIERMIEAAGGSVDSAKVVVEDLTLQMIVAMREKDDAKLKSLTTDCIAGWSEALPVFAVELRERFRQFTGSDSFDLRAGESLVDGDYAAVRCTGPKELGGKCLVLFFCRTDDGWRNCSLRNSSEDTPLEGLLAELKNSLPDRKTNPSEEPEPETTDTMKSKTNTKRSLALALGLSAGAISPQVKADDDAAAMREQIAALEKRLAEVENDKGEDRKLERLREKNKEKARKRASKDRRTYKPEELAEIESLYQVANKNWRTDEARESLKKLLAKYDKANRTGCATLYMGQMSKGQERVEYLTRAVEKFSDCYYFNGCQVGGYGRYVLALTLWENGEKDKARELLGELKERYKDAIDHKGRSMAAVAEAAEEELEANE